MSRGAFFFAAGKRGSGRKAGWETNSTKKNCPRENWMIFDIDNPLFPFSFFRQFGFGARQTFGTVSPKKPSEKTMNPQVPADPKPFPDPKGLHQPVAKRIKNECCVRLRNFVVMQVKAEDFGNRGNKSLWPGPHVFFFFDQIPQGHNLRASTPTKREYARVCPFPGVTILPMGAGPGRKNWRTVFPFGHGTGGT